MPQCWYYTGIDDNQECWTVSSKAACQGEYRDGEDCPGKCFFVSELSSYIIAKSGGDLVMEVAAQPGVWIASDFREVILRHSVLGREAVELYAAHAKLAIETLGEQPELLGRALQLVTKAILFAQDILRIHTLKGQALVTGAYKLEPDTVREIIEVAGELRRLSHNHEFDHLVSRVDAIFRQMEGMTTTQILELLAHEKPRP